MSIERMIRVSKVNPLLLLLGLALFIVALFYLAKGVFTLLSWVFPVFLIGALVINYRVVLGYGKWLLSSLKRNPIFGIIAIALTILGIPFVSVGLFLAALAKRGIDTEFAKHEQASGEFISFEEVNEDVLELPQIQTNKKTKDNDYDNVFE